MARDTIPDIQKFGRAQRQWEVTSARHCQSLKTKSKEYRKEIENQSPALREVLVWMLQFALPSEGQWEKQKLLEPRILYPARVTRSPGIASPRELKEGNWRAVWCFS